MNEGNNSVLFSYGNFAVFVFKYILLGLDTETFMSMLNATSFETLLFSLNFLSFFHNLILFIQTHQITSESQFTVGSVFALMICHREVYSFK